MSLDLSKAIKLRKVDLAFGDYYDRLQPVLLPRFFDSITSDHRDFEQVSIHFPPYTPPKHHRNMASEGIGAALARLDKLHPNCVKAVWDSDRDPSSSTPQVAVKKHLEELMPDMMQEVEIKFDFEKEGRHQYSVMFNL